MQDEKSVDGQEDRHSTDSKSEVAPPQNPCIAPGAALQAIQQLLDDFADTLSMSRKREQCMMHAEAGSAQIRCLESEGSGYGVCSTRRHLPANASEL
jgi:hypothetical protein